MPEQSDGFDQADLTIRQTDMPEAISTAVAEQVEQGDLPDKAKELLPFRTTLDEFIDHLNQMLLLVRNEPVFTQTVINQEEVGRVAEQLIAWKTKLDTVASPASAQEVFDAVKQWWDTRQPIFETRFSGKLGYFEGSIPDTLASQYQLFNQLKGDFDRLTVITNDLNQKH